MDRQDLVERAKLAETAERYDDMVSAMKSVATMDGGLDTEERNLLSVGYKNIIGARRASWRVIRSVTANQSASSNMATLSQAYLTKIAKEVSVTCDEVLHLLTNYLIPEECEKLEAEKSVEMAVFYLKMKGDYCRYLAEVSEQDSKKEATSKAQDAYNKAYDLAQKRLKSTNPIRLGLALNYSVFFYEIMGEQDKACEVAKKAFDDAIADLDNLPEDSYKDSTLIMQLIRDNLTLWTSGDEDEKGEDN